MRKSRPPLDRFVEKIAPESAEACWPWLGAVFSGTGYGAFNLTGSAMTTAHRAAYELLVGVIPDGMHLDHLCRNRTCVNPAHLEPVTLGENNRRAGAAVAACRNGHPYTPDNTYRTPRGYRRCRECNRESCRRRYVPAAARVPRSVGS